MRYKLQDIPDLIRTPLGRKQVLHGIYIRATPLFYWAAFLYRRTIIRKIRIIAVVGSFGKTTTSRLLLKAFTNRIHKKHDQNAGISLARNILRIKPWVRYGVVEVGISKIGQMAKSAKIVRPDITVVTSIGSEHNRSFKTLEVTREEKSKMVRVLPPKGTAFLNGDDPNVRMMTKLTKAKTIFFGMGPDNEVRATDISIEWPMGTRFTLHTNSEKFRADLPLLGIHMVYPALAAIAVGLDEGLGLEHILDTLETIEPAKGRMQSVKIDNGSIILRDDFKSSFETIGRVFDVAAEIPSEKRRILVLGEVSEPPGSAGPLYQQLGERMAGIFSKVYLVCNNTGFKQYRAGALRAGLPKEKILHFKRNDITDLIEILKKDMGPNDVILLKGRQSQRLGRVALALQGRPVKCTLGECDAKSTDCHKCPMLEKGWEGRRVLI